MIDETIQAFFSYSHRDWKVAERNGPIPNVLGHLFDQIEREVRAAEGVDRFTKWVDQERLLWADKWSDELERAIAASELFFVFLSPGWLASKVCRRELETFRDRRGSLDGKRVFVSQIQPLSPKQLSNHRKILAELRHLQCKADWQSLLIATEDARVAACQKAGREVAEQLERLHSAQPLTPETGVSRRCSAPRLTGERKLASGALLIPNQGDIVDGDILVQLRLLFREWCEVRTRRGILTFGASSAELCLEATGGTMKTHPELVAVRRSTKITASEAEGHTKFFYTIESLDGTLRGNVLSEHDDYVPAVNVTPTGDAPITVSGQMSLAICDIAIDPTRSAKKHRARLTSGDEDIRRKMHEALAKLILNEHFKEVNLGRVEA